MPWIVNVPFDIYRLLVAGYDLVQKKTMSKMVTTLLTKRGKATLLSIKVICLGIKLLFT